MSKSIKFIEVLGGEVLPTTESLAAFYCDRLTADNISVVINKIPNTMYNGGDEWTFDDGSIITLWYAGIYAKEKWYFMAYDCAESDAIRHRRANPTPDTSHE